MLRKPERTFIIIVVTLVLLLRRAEKIEVIHLAVTSDLENDKLTSSVVDLDSLFSVVVVVVVDVVMRRKASKKRVVQASVSALLKHTDNN